MFKMKSVGKPYAGKLHVRFDEGGRHPCLSLLYLLLCGDRLYKDFMDRVLLPKFPLETKNMEDINEYVTYKVELVLSMKVK